MRESHSERRKFFLSIEISAISLKFGLIKLFEETELLNQNDLKQNIIRDCFLRNKKITYCLKPDPSCKCKNWWSKVQTVLQVDSFTLKGWNSTMRLNYLILLRENKSWLCTELDRRERVLQEDCMMSLQETEKLKKDGLYRS